MAVRGKTCKPGDHGHPARSAGSGSASLERAADLFKANYRRHWTRDFLGNPTARLGGYQFGVATYF